ncbi:amidohydrolase 3 [Aspergillus pseudoustus]|uniref:Amidohydrolase 3 n=1 Tax=Aspergillus pseudoustus TaxID=1810923 RepID=A0ABR4IQU4_9EURO
MDNPSHSRSDAVAYYNGKVFTVNQKQPWVTAFIVSGNGVFEAVGSDEEILKLARQRRLVQFNLDNMFIMPGIHDSHSHMLLASLHELNEAALNLEVGDTKIAQKLQDGHCICSYQSVRDDWIIANTYLAPHFPDGRPDRRYLDDMFPNTPVVVREVSSHKLLVNTAALKRLNIDDSIEDPPGGTFLRRPDGTLTGEASEQAMSRIWMALPIVPMSHVKRGLSHAVSVCHKYGITSVQEATATTPYLYALKELEAENRLDLDIYTHILAAPTNLTGESEESITRLLDIAEGFRGKHVHPQFVKFIADGAPIPPTLTQADLDDQGRTIEKHLVVGSEQLERLVRLYDSRGKTCKVHAAGQGSVRMVLNVFEKVRTANPNGPRHEIAHCNSVHPDDVKRFEGLRITAEMSPAIFDAKPAPGLEYLSSWDFAGFLETNALVTIGSDWIVTPTPNLFQVLRPVAEKIGAHFKTETQDGDGLTDLQRGSQIVLRLLTLNGAEAVGSQHRTGSIEVGKKANFIALDRDLTKGDFVGTQVTRTWFEGRLVFSIKADHKL